jgi:hypothetical protein
MLSDATNLFVKKRQALPAYEAPPGVLSALVARIQGWLSRIIGWLFPRHDERVDVLLPPPPQVYGLATLFQSDPNHDLEAVAVCRDALAKYRRTHKERDGWPYPLRCHTARHTGVPSFVNGYLEQPISFSEDGTDLDRESAAKWFTQELISQMLFGVDWGRAAPRLEYVEAALVPWSKEIRHPAMKELRGQVWAHARFQQMVDLWPVFGAQVVVHLRDQDPRVSCTSSYFPLRDSLTLREPANLEQARQTARRLAVQAVAGRLTGIEAIGLYIELLAQFLLTEDETILREWTDWHTQVAFDLIQALSQDDPDRFTSLAALPPSTPPTNLFHALREQSRFLDEYRWSIGIVPYAGSELFVYPFAGHYYLAHLVELTPPKSEAPWRVFVDTDQELVLGPPENSVLHAVYFSTSGDALQSPPVTSDLEENVGDLQDAVKSFMHMVDSEGDSLTLADQAANSQLLLEGVNIAYHARALFDCFGDPEDLGISLGSGIQASHVIAQGNPIEVTVGTGGNNFQVNFSKTDQPPKGQIIFQTMAPNNLNGLATLDNREIPASNPRVFAPSLDREIIFHEFAHAFMWKLRFDPSFGIQDSQRPFIFPLLEGYATFFARSLAVRDDFDPADADRVLWARAAYRRTDWGSTWAASRSGNIPGADMLPWPNIYPKSKTEGVQAYEVSMVWVRALWDIAWLLANPQVPSASPDDVNQDARTTAFKSANRLALNSYFYLHGLTANYELAAEGIVDGAAGLNNPPIQADLKQALKNRGIYAGQGVQALAESPTQSSIGSQLFVGSDQGVARWDGQQADPLVPMNLPDGSGVVALQADADFLYAASESAVWKRPLAGPGGWFILGGSFPADQLPLSMAVLDGKVIVGTSDGLWACSNHSDNSVNIWQRIPVGGMAANMTVNDLGIGSDQIVLVSTLTNRVYVVPRTAVANPNDIRSAILDSAERATSAALFGGALYVGTVQGVRRLANFQPSTGTGSAWNSETVCGAAVLCMVVDRVANRVGAGTTNGLYWRDASGVWQHDTTIPPAAQDAIVASVLPGSRFVIGTLNQGLFVRENNAWRHQPL